MASSDIPDNLNALSTDFLAGIVGADVTSIAIETIGQDAGILGALARVHLTYAAGSQGPASVVVKMPTDSEENREVGMAFRFYEREGLFYSDLADSCGIAVPHCFLSYSDPERETFVLVLEDLEGLDQRNQVDGLTADEAALVVEHLARLHGRWWATEQLDQLRWLPRIDGSGERDLSLEIYSEGWQRFLDRFGHSLSEDAIVAGAAIRRAFGEVIDHLGTPPLTLVHGDFRVDNLFLDVDNPTRPLVVIDWQIAYKGRGVFDVAYLLGGSLTTDDRRRLEFELLERYHDALCRAGVAEYSLDACLEDYRWSLMYATLYPIDAGSFELPSEAAHDMVDQWARRFFTAVVDLECINLLA
jgi:thiamine kinase-like enzyme